MTSTQFKMISILLFTSLLPPFIIALNQMDTSSLIKHVCNDTKNSEVAKFAHKSCTSGSGCFRKCCPEGFALKSVYRLQFTNNSESIFNYDDTDEDAINEEYPNHETLEPASRCTKNKSVTTEFIMTNYEPMKGNWKGEHLNVLHGRCPHAYDYSLDQLQCWFPNGTIKITVDNITLFYDMLHNEYCLDYSQDRDIENIQIYIWNRNSHSPPLQKMSISTTEYVISSLIVVSMIFLAITFFVFSMKTKKNVNQYCIINQVIALFFALLFSLGKKLIVVWFESYPLCICKFIAFSLQFSFLATFFWMNAMCFDMWWILGRFNIMKLRNLEKETYRIRLYFMYAWGVPTIITLVTLYKELQLIHNKEGTVFPERYCFFDDHSAYRKYFYENFMIVILIINMCFFVSTAIAIEKQQRTISENIKTPLKSDRKRLTLYFKMFLVMGCGWLFNVLSAYNEYLSAISNIFNSLQGVFIFIIYVYKRKSTSAKSNKRSGKLRSSCFVSNNSRTRFTRTQSDSTYA